MKQWPTHLGAKRAFQARKRREYAACLAALRTFRIGCAYLPDGRDASALIKAPYYSYVARKKLA